MPSWITRMTFVGGLLAALVATGAVSQGREFGWVEWGDHGARGLASSVREGDGWRVGLGDGRVTVSLKPGETASRVPVVVTVAEGGRVRTGRGSFVVEESGAFVAGRLEADLDGAPLHGGLRVRVQ